MSDAGDTTTLTDGSDGNPGEAALDDGDVINVIAVMPDGNEEVLASTEYNA